jgi:hypothetical protein
MVSQMADFTSSRAFRVAGPKAFAEAVITHSDVDHLMIYDAFAHLPIYGLEDLGFVPRGEAGAFIAERNTAPGGKLPLNTGQVATNEPLIQQWVSRAIYWPLPLWIFAVLYVTVCVYAVLLWWLVPPRFPRQSASQSG